MDDAVIASVRKEFDALRGKMLALFEAIGLPERQELAVKSSYKNLSYNAQEKVLALLAEPKLITSLRDVTAAIAELDELLDIIEDAKGQNPLDLIDSRYQELTDKRDELAHLLRVASRLGVQNG